MQIIQLIIAFMVMVIVLVSLLMLIKADEKEKERRKCMMNHPAGSQLKTELSPIGQITETFPTYPHHLQGD